MFKRGFSFAPGYRLEQFLGRGQFGQVWRATAPGGASAAIKFIDLSGGEGAKEHEGVRRVKQIRHANLMPITAIWLLDHNGQAVEEAPEVGMETIDLGPALAAAATRNQIDPEATAASLPAATEHDPSHGLATGFNESPAHRDSPQVDASWLAVGMLLGGQSLQHRLRDCVKSGLPGIPPRELLSYMEESAKGLDFLNQPRHDLGEGPVAIQHCDVKPANIVLIGSSAVVCDFGLARILSRNQITATSASGTPAYMAPEAISGRPSRTSDQYSLAVTYYHLRTGTLPVNDGTLWEVLDAHRNGRLDLSRVPEHEQAVLRQATAIDWEQRFESNQDMVDALREALRLEGQTRPVLMPSVSRLGEPATAPTLADPSLTLMPGQSIADAQAPEAAGAETRNDRLADRTLATAEDRPRPTQPAGDASLGGPAAAPWWKQPKWAAAASVPLVAAAWLVIQVATTGINGSTANGSKADEQTVVVDSASAGGAVIPEKVIPEKTEVTALTAEQHLAAARSMLETDDAAAVESFRQALELDPALRELRPTPLTGHSGQVRQLGVSRDGRHLVSVADDPSEFVWTLQDLNAPPSKRSAQAGAILEAVALSPEPRQRLASAGDSGELVISDLSEPAGPLRSWNTENDYVISLAWHPQGRYLVAATLEQAILLIDTQAPPAAAPAAPWRFDVSMPIDSIAIDPAGQWLLILGEDGNVSRIGWPEVEAITQVAAAPMPQAFASGGTQVRKMVPVVVSDRTSADPAASVLVSGGDDGEVTIWSLAAEAKPLSRAVLHTKQVEVIAVTPRGLAGPIASGGGDGVIRVIRDGTASNNALTLSGHDQLIAALDLSADGRWLVAGSHDGDVTLWDLDPATSGSASSGSAGSAARRPMLRLRAEAGVVHSVRIDPAGRWIIAGNDYGLLTVWDLQHAQLLLAVEPSPEAAPQRQPDSMPRKPELPPGQAT